MPTEIQFAKIFEQLANWIIEFKIQYYTQNMILLLFSWSPHLSESLLHHWNWFKIPSISFGCALGYIIKDFFWYNLFMVGNSTDEVQWSMGFNSNWGDSQKRCRWNLKIWFYLKPWELRQEEEVMTEIQIGADQNPKTLIGIEVNLD